MEELIDYSVDSLEDVPIWTQPHSSMDVFFSFNNKLSKAVDALPSISDTKVSSITLLEDTSSLLDLMS